MRLAAYIGGLLGLALLLALVVRADFAAMLHTLLLAGWRLLWLIPYRGLFFLLYAWGWRYLLRPYDPGRRAGIGYLFWVTTVREAIDRLLPVASVGGGVAAVRLLRWRDLPAPATAATVIVEVLLTLTVAYLFTALGLVLLIQSRAEPGDYHHIIIGLLSTLPVPAAMALLLRYGSVFARLQRLLRPLVGAGGLSDEATALDRDLRAVLHRRAPLITAGALQFAAFASGAFEVWFALRLFGHPVGIGAALILESMTQALRHLAFMIPAAVGVQEAALVLFGQALGVSAELALAVSMAKRLREILCGVPALASWQWIEGHRLRTTPDGLAHGNVSSDTRKRGA